MTEWYQGVQERFGITPYLKIDKPSKWLIQNYYKSGDKDIFFYGQFSITDHQIVNVEFPAALKNKQAWLGMPRQGSVICLRMTVLTQSGF